MYFYIYNLHLFFFLIDIFVACDDDGNAHLDIDEVCHLINSGIITFPSENLDIVEYSLTTLTRGFTLKEFLTAMKTWEVVIPPMFAGIPIGNRTINNQEDGDIDRNGNIINKIMKRTTKNQSEIALDIVFNSVSPYIFFLLYIYIYLLYNL